MRHAPVCLVALVAAAPARADAGDDDGIARVSLDTRSDEDAWRQPGFRLQLGVAAGDVAGLGGAPSGRLIGPILRVGLRLDDSWSIVAGFEYLSAQKGGGLSGLRYAGTLEPTWHVSSNLSVSVGLGFGGIVEGTTGRADPDPKGSTLDNSYTFPDASTPLPSCSGLGVTGLARGEWMWLLGPRSSLGVAVEVFGQWTGCQSSTGRVEPDTGEPIVRRQWWPSLGATLGLVIEWR